MTEDQFKRYSYKPFMFLDYWHPRYPNEVVHCLLVEVNFDDHIFKLSPFEELNEGGKYDFYTGIKNVYLPERKLKISKKPKK
jgi:hypothetical protein